MHNIFDGEPGRILHGRPTCPGRVRAAWHHASIRGSVEPDLTVDLASDHLCRANAQAVTLLLNPAHDVVGDHWVGLDENRGQVGTSIRKIEDRSFYSNVRKTTS